MEEEMREVKILIAERDQHLRSALKLLLSNDHPYISIKEADNVDNFVKMLSTGEFDLIIMDWLLNRTPIQNLLSLYRQQHENVTILALSSRLEDKTSAISAGADAFIFKGDSPEILHNTLLAYIQKTSQDSESAAASMSSYPRPLLCHYLV